MKNLSLLLFVILSMTSCVEVVQLDLRSVEPEVVIEGKITDSAFGNEVKITLTQDFQQRNEFPPITTAEVTVTDVTTGQSGSLFDSNPQGSARSSLQNGREL
jgi:hypothetical protein